MSTLLEDLERAAHEVDCPVSPLCPGDVKCSRRAFAADLREHAKRLRERYQEHRKYHLADGDAHALAALKHINGGPVNP